jgi:DNA-binding XRE family transcriptional regulator
MNGGGFRLTCRVVRKPSGALFGLPFAAERGANCMTASKFDRDLPKRLRSLRNELGLSELQAAQDHGVTLRTYRGWESGRPMTPSAGPMLKFCDSNKISPDYYCGLSSLRH